jgi:hypothetical protein
MSEMIRMRHTVLAAALLLAACQPQERALGPADFNLTGTWRQSGDFRDQATGESHIHLGRFTWSQAGDQFQGDGQQDGLCSTATGSDYRGPLADNVPFAVTEGVVTELGLQFRAGVCEYQGAFENGNPDRITGSAICRYELDGLAYAFRGRWQADRLQ